MEKKQLILDAALRLFVEFGFHDTPTSKIAKEAGVANGTLFYFFPTKDDLVKALYIELKSKMVGCMADSISEEMELKEILKRYYKVSLTWALSHQREFAFLEQFNNSPYARKIAKEEIEIHTRSLFSILQKGIDLGVLKQLDLDLIFSMISGHTFGVHKYLSEKSLSPTEAEQVIDDTFELIWSMITI
jgi:AcrR family transcriptional regulator